MISLRKYFVLSALAAGAVIYHAFATRRQFFPAAVALTTSKLAVATVGNLSFAMALCMYNLVIKIFLGTLREIELERVKEKLSSAIMETCLALTIFRDEFNMSFVGMFTVLTFVKVFHWLVQDRVDYIEVTPSVSRLAHTRIVTFLLVLLSLDVAFLHQTIAAALAHKGHSVQILFAFEYIILASAAAATFLKYVLSMLDAAMEGRWDGKGTYVFYLELLTDMLHLFVYCIFFVIVCTNHGLPLHLIRDLYMTFRNFRNRITDFLRFRQVTARMDRFPDASADDLARCDGICIICREEMVSAGLNKKLHCGHVFHLHCLRSWLERQQNCPTCRTSVFRPPAPAEPAAAAPAAAAADAGAAVAPGADDAAVAAAAPAAAAGAAGPVPLAAGADAAAGGMPAAGRAAAAGGHADASRAGLRHRSAAAQYRSRSPRAHPQSGAGSSAAAAAGAPADAAPVAGAQGIPGFWPNAGTMVWQMPQWYPVTSMATFSNAPLQYAGQQSALEQAQAQAIAAASMVPMVPAIIPALSAPFPAMIPPVSGPATPGQAHAAAAAAAMAAAAAAIYMPPMMPGLAMMPPAMLPGAGAGSAGEQMAAAAAANAAAAAAAAAVMGGAAPPEVMQASFEATQQMLQRQLEYLQSQMSRIRSSESAPPAQQAGQQQQQQTTGGSAATDGVGASTSTAAAPAEPTAAAVEAGAGLASGATADGSADSRSATAVEEPAAVQSQDEQQATAAGPVGDVECNSVDQTAPETVEASSSQGSQPRATTGGAVAAPATAGATEEVPSDEELRRRRLMHFQSNEHAGDS